MFSKMYRRKRRPFIRHNQRNNATSSSNMRRNFPRFLQSLEAWEAFSKMGSIEIIQKLMTNAEEFSKFLETDLEPDWIVVTIAILAKVCSCRFSEKIVDTMNLAAKVSFTETLQNYIVNLQFEERKKRNKNNLFWNNPNDFFANLVVVCEFLIQTIPTKACEVLPKLLKIFRISFAIFEKEQDVEVDEMTKLKLTALMEEFYVCKTELEKNNRKQHESAEPQPSDDFRLLSVYPTSEEILNPKRPFVRKNIIEGGYDSVEHYLDVQFRLLKEDFVGPLRQGLTEYFEQTSETNRKFKFSNVKIHPSVFFRTPIFEKDRVGVILEFPDKKSHEYIFSHRSQRLVHGSLVVFTKDSFVSLLFGTVLERDDRKKQIIIRFQQEYSTYELNVSYMMVECQVFFEPYYHVLKALQCISAVDFPMKSYLIDVNSRVEPPAYLNVESAVFNIQDDRVNLFGNNWPSADELQLNSTQYSAFKAALTQKFVVIQGPPGTGKTYLGLKIVKTLLHDHNKNLWYDKTPMLIVCYTNHALDQFLEGLISTTNEIVRVGGRSKNENMTSFNLRNLRKTHRIKNNVFYGWKNMIEKSLSKLKNYSDKLKQIKNYNHIIAFKHFASIDNNIRTSWFYRASNSEILAWLFGEQKKKTTENTSNLVEEPSVVAQDEDSENNTDEVEDTEYSTKDDFIILAGPSLIILESISNMERNIIKTENLLDMQSNTDQEAEKKKDAGVEKWMLQAQLADLKDILKYFKMRMQDGEVLPSRMQPVNVNYSSPHLMDLDDRWNLYFYWLNLYKNYLVEKLVSLQRQYDEIYKFYSDARSKIDAEIMKNKLVIGMTTTGAARLQTTLKDLKCRIVIVEEAAEVLESHITVSLTNDCQHLILIGDHQQLRPSTADYWMNTKFNLGISMFERMVLNKIQCNVLGVQHRMRPEMAQLIVPHIYPKLESHYSVVGYPPIKGIDSALFFIHHENREKQVGDSKSNLYEAKFLIKLACYLRKVGYEPEEITILSAYSGQMFVLCDERQKYQDLLKGVRISVLDNYQGEECKIILLSLVRNNCNEQIGFIKTENRVCVALSRAKHGLYIMGNLDLLCQNSEIWPKIEKVLVKLNALGNHLTIRCEVHPDHVTKLKELEDFDKVPEGGCLEICGKLLECNHNCTEICHIRNRDHTINTCTAPCSKVICINGHICPKICKEECGNCRVKMTRSLECGHECVLLCYQDPKEVKCKILVPATLPCGHEVLNKPCHEDAKNWKCNFPCNKKIESCGHTCTYKCHINKDPEHLDEYGCWNYCEKTALGCTTKEHKCRQRCSEKCLPCRVEIKKLFLNCNHTVHVACSTDMSLAICFQPCNELLSCGHKCPNLCQDVCGSCDVQVQKLLSSCGHQVNVQCSKTPNNKDCRGACSKQLACGHLCKKMCNEICTTECRELVDVDKAAPCAHQFKVMCYLRSKMLSNDIRLSRSCREPCNQILECFHKCSGTCGTCFQGRIHLACSKMCDIPQTCGHIQRIRCREITAPSEHQCSFKCRHVKYRRGIINCNAPCARRCKHVQCKAKCWEECTVAPCQKPCDKMLKCGHPCIGFCGEPCPRLCRICDKEKYPEIFLDDREEESTRFVLLEECNHVVDSKELEECFQQRDVENGVLVDCRRCPRCKIPLTSTQRFSDYIKKNVNDSFNIKMKIYGRLYERKLKYEQLVKMLNFLKNIKKNCWFLVPPCFARCMQIYRSILDNQNESFNLLMGKQIETKFTIIERIFKIFEFNIYPTMVHTPIRRTNVNLRALHATTASASISNKTILSNQISMYWNYLLEFITTKVQQFTNQSILDIEREMCRFQKMKHILDITINSESIDISEVKELVFQPKPYTNDCDNQVTAKLEELYNQLGKTMPNMSCHAHLQDINFKRGCWYKCPNGHYFMDCADPTQIAKCEECWE